MHLEIITPEAKLFSGEAHSVQLPGANGSFQVLNNHAPVISSLIKGIVRVELSDNKESYEPMEGLIEKDKNSDKHINIHIKGGVIEMQNNKIIVLAE
jgi:F-type H+-transporting ATPase subunit epsilon